MDIITVIKEKYNSMTKKQKQIADYMVANPEKMTFITLKELRQELNVSEITILNACSMLNYSNFNEVKYEFRKYVSIQQKIELHEGNEYISSEIPNYELEDKENLLMGICLEEVEAMQNMMKNMKLPNIIKAADSIIHGEKVIICGRGTSRLVGEWLAIRLAVSGIGAIVVNTELNDSIHSVLPMITKDSVVIPISFPDYFMMTTKVAEFAYKTKAEIIGITNSPNAEISKYCNQLLLCPSATRIFLNTISAPMALVNILSSAIEVKLSSKKTRISPEKKFSQLF